MEKKTLKKLSEINFIKLVLALIVIAGSIYFLKYAKLSEFRAWINSFEDAAHIFYVVAFTFLPVFFFPVPVIVMTGALVFGILDSIFYSLIGICLNASLMFFLSRYIARDAIVSIAKKKISPSLYAKIFSPNELALFKALLMLRLFPFVSYNMVNYMSGISQIRYLPYIINTMIGTFPGLIIFINMGDKALDYKSPEFLMSVGIFIVFLIVTGIGTKMMFGNKKDQPVSRGKTS